MKSILTAILVVCLLAACSAKAPADLTLAQNRDMKAASNLQIRSMFPEMVPLPGAKGTFIAATPHKFPGNRPFACPPGVLCDSAIRQPGRLVVIGLPIEQTPGNQNPNRRPRECPVYAMCIQNTDILKSSNSEPKEPKEPKVEDPNDDAATDAKNVRCVRRAERCQSEGKKSSAACFVEMQQCTW